jgi:hypothetical protein
MLQIEQSTATPLEHLEFIVQTVDKAAVVTVDEIVDDFLPPPAQGVDELIETAQPLLATRLIQARILVLADVGELGWSKIRVNCCCKS